MKELDSRVKINQLINTKLAPMAGLLMGNYDNCPHCGMTKKLFMSVKVTNPVTKAWQTVEKICRDCISQVHKILPTEIKEEEKIKLVEDKVKTKLSFDKINALKKFMGK